MTFIRYAVFCQFCGKKPVDVIAPGASGELLTELCSRHMFSVDKEADEQVLKKRKKREVFEALAASYLNAQH